MAELRHSSSLGARAASNSPIKRDDDASPLIIHHNSDTATATGNTPKNNVNNPSNDDDDGYHHYSRHPFSRDRDRPFFSSHFPFLSDEFRVSRMSLILLFLISLAAFISLFSIYHRLNAPYLCKKDGIVLHCPHVKEPSSLWENPYSATTSWKPCAERRDGGLSDLPPENETNGYIFIHAEGGLNQQRIAV